MISKREKKNKKIPGAKTRMVKKKKKNGKKGGNRGKGSSRHRKFPKGGGEGQ